MKQFAVLQLAGCARCEVSLLNAGAWAQEYKLVHRPLAGDQFIHPVRAIVDGVTSGLPPEGVAADHAFGIAVPVPQTTPPAVTRRPAP